MVCQTAPFSMTVNEPKSRYQGRATVWCWVSRKWLKIRP